MYIKELLFGKSMNIRVIFCFFILLSLNYSCKGEKETTVVEESVRYKRFVSYKSFNDKPEKHMESALSKGVGPMQSRADTAKYKDKIKMLPQEMGMYRLDKLTHSIPYLTDDATQLLIQIGLNFQDSLHRKNLPEYKLIVTSVMRTQDDVNLLKKRNINASENSVHCYGTTFDVSWKRFQKIGPKGEDDMNSDKLKYILGQVLHDLRERGKCYVVHEKKQACFHVTVR